MFIGEGQPGGSGSVEYLPRERKVWEDFSDIGAEWRVSKLFQVSKITLLKMWGKFFVDKHNLLNDREIFPNETNVFVLFVAFNVRTRGTNAFYLII